MLSELTCWLQARVLGDSQSAWYALQFAVICALVFCVAWLDNARDTRFGARWTGAILFVLYVLSIAACWMPNFPRHHINPDEAQWIAQANNLVADPLLWFKHFLQVNSSRELTIWPLGLASWVVGGNLGYEGARVVAVLLWTLFAVAVYSIANGVFGRQVGLWASCGLVMVISSLNYYDYVAYNSELPVIVLCAAAMAAFMTGAARGSVLGCFVAGALLAAIPFAKSQGIPMAVVLGAAFAASLASMRNWRSMIWLLAGSVLTVASFFVLYALPGNWAEFIDLKKTSADYARHGMIQEDRSWLRKTLNLREMLVRHELRPLFLGSLVAIPFLLWSVLRRRPVWHGKQIFVLIVAISTMCAALFSAWYPGNLFHHYALLLLFPCSLIVAAALFVFGGGSHTSPWLLAFVFILVSLAALHREGGNEAVAELAENCASPERGPLTAKILEVTEPGDRLMIWGWWTAYFVETGLLQGARWMYPVFATGPYGSAASNVRRYMEDMKLLRPKVIVEWIADDAIHLKDPARFGLQAVPEINNYVMANYELVETSGNQKLFLRKE